MVDLIDMMLNKRSQIQKTLDRSVPCIGSLTRGKADNDDKSQVMLLPGLAEGTRQPH